MTPSPELDSQEPQHQECNPEAFLSNEPEDA
jgi:hypothetical protein